jgi:hypothetical protein
MAQGGTKAAAKPKVDLGHKKYITYCTHLFMPLANYNRAKVLGPRAGRKVIKPKQARLVQRQKMLKKHSAGLHAKTEKHLAERAGHLELLSGGKKNRDDKAKAAAKKVGKMQ